MKPAQTSTSIGIPANTNRILDIVKTTILVLLGIWADHPTLSQPYLYTVSMNDDLLRIVDPWTAKVVDSLTIEIPDIDIKDAQGLATNPITGELWGLFNGTTFAIIDPETGKGTRVGVPVNFSE